MKSVILPIWGLLLTAVMVVGSNGQSTTGAAPVGPVTPQEEAYRIGFRDIVAVRVFRHPELDQNVPVNQNGTIVLFRLEKPVIAACKTERELSDDIAAAYKERYLRDPQVSVTVAEQRSQSIAVIGAVEKPANYFVNRRVSLLEMLAMAGGPNKEAGTRLIIARTGSSANCKQSQNDNEEVAITDLKIRDVQEGKSMVWLKPGDVVSVLDADMVYVYGNVNKQGAYKIRESITLTQALVTAEGLKPTAKKENVRILRQMPGSTERSEIIVDLNKIDKGHANDPILLPNDIVAVSQDSTKTILRGIGDVFKSSVPSVLYRLP